VDLVRLLLVIGWLRRHSEVAQRCVLRRPTSEEQQGEDENGQDHEEGYDERTVPGPARHWPFDSAAPGIRLHELPPESCERRILRSGILRGRMYHGIYVVSGPRVQ